jgi:hypothetical protein
MFRSDYRKKAAECLEIARHMSLDKDRACLIQMAERWSRLADEAQSKEPSGDKVN